MRFAISILAASAVANTVVAIDPIFDPPVEPELTPDIPERPGVTSNPDAILPDTTVPQKAEPYLPASEANPCFGDKGPSCDDIVQVATSVFSGILSLVSIAAGTSSGNTAVNTAVYNAVPVFDVAAAFSVDPNYLGVFNAAEYDMYRNDPLCFYANLERQYIAAYLNSATSPTFTTETSTTTAPTAFTTTEGVYGHQTVVTSTQIGSSEFSIAQSYLFRSLFPWMIKSIYAQVSQARNTTVSYVTSTTTCSGLDGASSFTTPYVAQVSITSSMVMRTLVPGPASTSTSTGAAMPTKYIQGSVLSGAAYVVGLAYLGAT